MKPSYIFRFYGLCFKKIFSIPDYSFLYCVLYLKNRKYFRHQPSIDQFWMNYLILKKLRKVFCIRKLINTPFLMKRKITVVKIFEEGSQERGLKKQLLVQLPTETFRILFKSLFKHF